MNCLAIETEPFEHAYFVRKVLFEKWVIMALIPQEGGESAGCSGIHSIWVDLRAVRPQVLRGSLSSSFLSKCFIQAQHSPSALSCPSGG